MNQNTIQEIYESREGSLLYRQDYKLDYDGHWKREIDSSGLGLTQTEQEINSQGGREYGTDAAVVLAYEIEEVKNRLSGYDDDEIGESRELYWLRDWLNDASK